MDNNKDKKVAVELKAGVAADTVTLYLLWPCW